MADGVGPHPGRRAGLLGIGSLILILGAAWLVAGSLRGEPSAASTTTTSTPFAIAGEDAAFAFAPPLAWREVADLGNLEVAGVAHLNGRMIVYGWDEPAERLHAVTSTDGRNWERRPVAPGPGRRVEAAGDAVIAHSGPATGPPDVWVSRDGTSFERLVVPISQGRSAPGGTEDLWNVDVAAVRGDTVVVGVQRFNDPIQSLDEALPERFRAGASDHYGVGIGGPPFRVVVHGPLGITLWSASAADLGMSSEAFGALFEDPPGQDGTYLLVTDDGTTWEETFLPFTWFHAIDLGDDGAFVAAVDTDRGSQTMSSEDGLSWESQSSYDSIDQITSWGSGWIATRYRGARAQLVRSDDATRWEEIDLELLLPDSDSWHFAPVVAGPVGIAALAHGFDDPPQNQPPLAEIARDGYALVADDTVGTIRLTRDAIETHRITMWSGAAPEHVTIDFDAETLTFLDPSTEETLVTFSFAELTGADRARWNGGGPTNNRNALLFSSDGIAWTIDDSAETFGPGRLVFTMLMGDTAFVAVVGEFTSGAIVDRTSIWLATLPES